MRRSSQRPLGGARGSGGIGLVAGALLLLGAPGCYHFTFEQTSPHSPAPVRTVTYETRVPTFFDGFLGDGKVNTRSYCLSPLRTELRVTAPDALVSLVTLLVYTPHTLYVTCDADDAPRPMARDKARGLPMEVEGRLRPPLPEAARLTTTSTNVDP